MPEDGEGPLCYQHNPVVGRGRVARHTSQTQGVILFSTSQEPLLIIIFCSVGVPQRGRVGACVEIKFRAPHAIDAMLASSLRLLDGVEVSRIT